MSKTLEEFQNEIGAWHAKNMPGAKPMEVLIKLEEEVGEFVRAPVDEERLEAADVMIAMLAYANLKGFSLSEAIEAKMAINRARTWERQADGTYRHVKSVVPTYRREGGTVGFVGYGGAFD